MCAPAGADQIRSTSGALTGDRGGASGLSGVAAGADDLRRNDATGVSSGEEANPCASVRSAPGPATSAICPSGQQLPQAAVRAVFDTALSAAETAGSGGAGAA